MPNLSELISEHVHKHWKQHTCQLCGHNDWTLNGPFSLVPALVNPAGYVVGERPHSVASPVVSMVCRSCGQTILIDYNVVIGREP